MNDNEVDGDDATEQAAHWYARLETLPVSARTLEQFFEWRKIPGNREAFDAVDLFYRETGTLAGRPAIAAATAQALTRSAGPSDRQSLRIGAMAAAVIGVGVVGLAIFGAWPLSGDRYATTIGEQRTIPKQVERRLKQESAWMRDVGGNWPGGPQPGVLHDVVDIGWLQTQARRDEAAKPFAMIAVQVFDRHAFQTISVRPAIFIRSGHGMAPIFRKDQLKPDIVPQSKWVVNTVVINTLSNDLPARGKDFGNADDF